MKFLQLSICKIPLSDTMVALLHLLMKNRFSLAMNDSDIKSITIVGGQIISQLILQCISLHKSKCNNLNDVPV